MRIIRARVFLNLHTDVCADEYGCDCADYRALAALPTRPRRICQDTDSCVAYIYDNVVKIRARA